MKLCIDYGLIQRAIEHYTGHGYKYVDAEWTAPKYIMNLTMPSFAKGIDATLIGPLIGSGEQYFLNEIFNGRLKRGKYCCATPCFRDDVEDELHGLYFFKVELIDTVDHDYSTMIGCAQELFDKEGMLANQVATDADHFQVDLVDDKLGLELGSYGLRSHFDTGTWVYGTGVAEPRFSIVKEKYNER